MAVALKELRRGLSHRWPSHRQLQVPRSTSEVSNRKVSLRRHQFMPK